MKKSVSMKATRKLFWSFMSVLFALSSLITASYAWFSMNSTVSVTGMTLETRVENNLAIASSTKGQGKSADSEFRSSLHQVVDGKLQPVSSVDGVNFFYTNDAAEDGHKVGENAYTDLDETTNTITINSVDYKGFVDYVFELKAANTSDNSAYLVLTKLNLLYAGTDATTHAFRVAVFVQEEDPTFAAKTAEAKAAADASGYVAIDGVTSSIFAKSGSAYFTTGQAVSGTAYTALSTVPATTAISKEVAANDEHNAIKYFKVTVRLWLEGEDTDCYNTKFIELTNKWSLDLAFELKTENSGTITSLGSVANATNTKSDSGEFTAALVSTVGTASSYQWYKVGESEAINGATNATFTPTTDGSYYCAITTTKGNVYYTPAVKK